ncbi:hypothetical protein AAFC00_003978 [Neodothiora populina]|uniref:Zinc/iron permease n=1 Tax=Neodothiora populina TaxID=2781224 RepID=A0ABR3PI49_9PEZI
MWDGLFVLLGLSIVMAVASFLAGALPLAFTMSTRQLRLITAVGTGVLVGTSLIVIIPEGVETLYAARGVESAHSTRSIALGARHNAGWLPSSPVIGYQEHELLRRDGFTFTAPHIRQEGGQLKSGPDDGHPDGPIPGTELDNNPSHDHVDDHHHWEPHAWIGVSVIFGFILMYLIDKLPRHALGSSQPKPSHISLNRFTLRRTGTQNEEIQDEDDFPTVDEASQSRPSSTTVGLVIHAAADGIALGASSAGSSQRLGFIVFLALMIHKAPAAFGLTSALLKQGLSKRRARTHLIIFSLSAPIGALVTWAVANTFGGGRFSGEEGTHFATGVLLLFSGGTFLYVAMHTMQDESHDHTSGKQHHHHGGHAGQNGYGEAGVYDGYQAPAMKDQGQGLVEIFATVGGMLLPLLTQFGHAD